MLRLKSLCLEARPGVLNEGLFGGIFIHVFATLPYLAERGIYPKWSIASTRYGHAPDFTILPGVLDLAYRPPAKPARVISFRRTVTLRGSHIGSDWPRLHSLWSAYFRVPVRIENSVASMGDLRATLGVHYRGNDKQTATWDTNPISHDDFLAIIDDVVKARPEVTRVFAATDDPVFLTRIRKHLHLPVISRGAGAFHRACEVERQQGDLADMALTDCIVLSRCAAVLTTSSALSAFAKVFNPTLDIHRCAASKLFSDSPYFPIAFIPVYRSDDPAVTAILHRTMLDDWRDDPRARPFLQPFAFKHRRRHRAAVHWIRRWLRARLPRAARAECHPNS